MSKTYVVGVDDSGESSRALQFALKMAKESGASIKIIHVLEWSPYSFLTPEELDQRHKRRGEELERANTAIIDPIIKSLSSKDKDVTGEVRYGGIAETIAKFSEECKADMVFVNRSGEGRVSARLFGSVPGTLVQVSQIPVVVVP